MLGTRNVNKQEVVSWKEAHKGAAVGTFADTAKFGEILVLACEGGAVESVVAMAGKDNFSGKVIIDTDKLHSVIETRV